MLPQVWVHDFAANKGLNVVCDEFRWIDNTWQLEQYFRVPFSYFCCHRVFLF